MCSRKMGEIQNEVFLWVKTNEVVRSLLQANLPNLDTVTKNIALMIDSFLGRRLCSEVVP